MIYVIEMASGEQCPESQPVSLNRRAQQPEPESLGGLERPRLQLASTQLTASQPDSATPPPGLDIAELLQAAEE